MTDENAREFPTLLAWLTEWAQARTLALSAKGLNPAPIIVDSSLPAVSRYDRLRENAIDLGRIVGPKYLSHYDHDRLYSWLTGQATKLPSAQLRRIRKETMRAARIESRKPEARYRLRPVRRNGQTVNEYRYGDWG